MEGAALRAALGADDAVMYRPFTIDEAVYAGTVIAGDRCLPGHFTIVGVALDLMAVRTSRHRTSIARKIGIRASLTYAYENLWESLRQDVRFDIVQQAVRITMAVRAGGER